jgi:hypothetical protein
MVTDQFHIVRRQQIELSLSQEQSSYAIQREASRLFQEQVAPELSKLLDELGTDGVHLTIARLEIDLGSIPLADWENVFVARCTEALRKELPIQKQAIFHGNKDFGAIQPSEQSLLQQLFLFLRSGQLDTASLHSLHLKRFRQLSGISISGEELEAAFLTALDKGAILWQNRLRQLLENSDQSIRRLVQQFSSSFVMALMSHLYTPDFGQFISQFQDIGFEQRVALLHRIIRALPMPAGDLNGWLANLFIDMEISPKESNDGKKKVAGLNAVVNRQPAEDVRAGIPLEYPNPETTGSTFIENSGLVLLHPFLERLFVACGLTAEGNFISQNARLTGIQLLQYLCTGEAEHFEFSLNLNKILCGVPTDVPLIRDELLTMDMKKEADELLLAVIGHWSALKSTSIEGFRYTFLSRLGKLTPLNDANEWRLQIAPQGVDVLLDWLPWGYSYVKLPWMNGVIHTEWRFN